MPYKNPLLPGQGLTPQAPYRGLPPQQRYPPIPQTRQPPPPPPPSEQPLAFTMPIAVPSEVAEVIAKDNQGRVLWFGVPPVDIVGWSGEGIRGHSLTYLAAKKRKKETNGESMEDVQVTDTTDKSFKKRATELLVKALGTIGK